MTAAHTFPKPTVSSDLTTSARLAMAGVDLLTLKEVGGWKTTTMVQRYAHLSPGHLHQAVERLVNPDSAESGVELARN